jgi:hypothetical protein
MSAGADDRPRCDLLRPDSLAGWKRDAEGTSGWSIKDGQLAAKANFKTLLSGFSFGDFQMRRCESFAPQPLRHSATLSPRTSAPIPRRANLKSEI